MGGDLFVQSVRVKVSSLCRSDTWQSGRILASRRWAVIVRNRRQTKPTRRLVRNRWRTLCTFPPRTAPTFSCSCARLWQGWLLFRNRRQWSYRLSTDSQCEHRRSAVSRAHHDMQMPEMIATLARRLREWFSDANRGADGARHAERSRTLFGSRRDEFLSKPVPVAVPRHVGERAETRRVDSISLATDTIVLRI